MDLFPQQLIAATQPGAYSLVDATALVNAQRGRSPRTLAILGPALGGQPNTPLRISQTQDLKNVIRGGAVFDFARLAFQVVQPVTVVRIGTSIAQATSGTAIKGTTTSLGALTITSLGWGSYTNSIKWSVTAGALTITFLDSLTGITYSETYAPQTGVSSAAIPANIVAQINGTIPGIPKSQLVSAAVVPSGDPGPLITATSTALTGGADNGTIIASDWTAGLAAIEPIDVDFVCVATDDATIHAQVAQHCTQMSQPLARHERRAVFGGAPGETVTQTVARAQTAAIQSRRAQLVFPGVKMFDATGAIVTYSSAYAAAVIAGMHANLPDSATSLMHTQLPILDVETPLSTIPGGAVDTLLKANVSPITQAPVAGFWMVDSLSLEPTDTNWHDFIKQGAADTVQQQLRQRLESNWTGKKALSATAGSIALDARGIAANLKAQQIIRDYLGDQITVNEIPGAPGTYSVIVPVMLPDTVRFIGITVVLQPAATLTATASSVPTL